MHATAMALVAAMSVPFGFDQPSPDDMSAKPEVNFAALGVSYWRLVDNWADKYAVVTIDGANIDYSGHCEFASFPYKQDWGFDGGLGVSPHSDWHTCAGKNSAAFYRFYYALRESGSAKISGNTIIFGWGANVPLMQLERFEPDGLEIRRWVIAEYLSDRDTLTAPDLHDHENVGVMLRAPRITLDRGSVRGSPGCGALEGSYKLDGRSLRLNANFFYFGYCSADLLHEDNQVMAALGRVRRWDFEGREVILRGEKGEIEALLAPA